MAFPNVPIAPGVPPVPRALGAVSTIASILTSDLIDYITNILNQWGIFSQAGFPVIVADSVVGFDFKQEWNISNYPVEGGSFQSYNKVAMPFDVKVRMAQGGSVIDRQFFLEQVNNAAAATNADGTLTLFDVATPEITYPSCCIDHIDFQRTAQSGVGLLVVDIWLIQIKVTAGDTFTRTLSPNSMDPAGDGQRGPVQDAGTPPNGVALS